MYGAPYIGDFPDPKYGAPYVGSFYNPMDEDARKINALYRLGKKYRVWPLVFDIWITFSEYIELGYAGDRFYKAIELAYQMNQSEDWLLVYISRACKYNIKQLVRGFEFFETLKRTPQLSVDILAHVVAKLDTRDDRGFKASSDLKLSKQVNKQALELYFLLDLELFLKLIIDDSAMNLALDMSQLTASSLSKEPRTLRSLSLDNDSILRRKLDSFA